MKYLHKRLFRGLFFAIVIFALNPVLGFCESGCIADKTAIILSPYSWQRPGRSELIQEMKAKLQQLEYAVVIKENIEKERQEITLDDFVAIKSGNYSVAIVLTHSNDIGEVSTGIPSEPIDDNMLFCTKYVEEVEYLCLRPAFWENLNLSDKVLMVSSCELLKPTFIYYVKGSFPWWDPQDIKKYDGKNPIIDILTQSNAGGILGFKDEIQGTGNYGPKFISNYFLQELVDNPTDFATAVDTAKATYDESGDTFSPNAGEAATRIGTGEDFYLACVPPVPDIKINGSDNPTEIYTNQDYELTLSLDAGTYTGQLADHWWYVDTPTGRLPLITPTLEATQEAIDDFTFSIPGNTVGMEPGNYTFTFAVDDNADGVLDGTWSDSVTVNIVESLPLNRFIDNGDGTVTDTKYGLMWQKTDDGIQRNWENAAVYAENLILGEHTDWRLPNIEELKSIIDYEKFRPTINTDFFDCHISSYWSGSSYVGSAVNNAWTVYFDEGKVTRTRMSNYRYVRCVRSMPSGSFDSLRPILIDNGDGTSTDQTTGLMWQNEYDCVRRNWDNAYIYAEQLTLGGYTDWRLPTIEELTRLIDYTRVGPAINENFDSFCRSINCSDRYWSSTRCTHCAQVYSNDSSFAWHVYFFEGTVSWTWYAEKYGGYIRCVRNLN